MAEPRPVTMTVNFTARYLRGPQVLRMSRYAHDPHKMCLSAGDGTKLTVNVERFDPPADCIVVKNYSECEGIVADLVRDGVVEAEPVQVVRSGFVSLPVMRLTERARYVYAPVLDPISPEEEEDERLRSRLDSEADDKFLNEMLGGNVVDVKL